MLGKPAYCAGCRGVATVGVMAVNASDARGTGESIALDWTWGDRVRRVRRHVGASQAAFARSISVPQGTVATWESSDMNPRNIVELSQRIERAWGISALWMLGLTGSAPEAPQLRPTGTDLGSANQSPKVLSATAKRTRSGTTYPPLRLAYSAAS